MPVQSKLSVHLRALVARAVPKCADITVVQRPVRPMRVGMLQIYFVEQLTCYKNAHIQSEGDYHQAGDHHPGMHRPIDKLEDHHPQDFFK